ncbi:MAG: molybdopterin biosynthesis protein [Planctomycetes bacterium]|nr:molybdopterin biosynthesis protein [Planctomycetota bacterium]
MRQEQFLDVVDERTARSRFEAACIHVVPRVESVALAAALGRVLAADVRSGVDVPAFDRSDVDGFAVRASDTFGAEELAPVRLALSPVRLAAGSAPPTGFTVPARTAVPVATGGVLPRGADAVVMIEYTRPDASGHDDVVFLVHAVAPGAHVSFAGSDLGRGEIVLRRGTLLTSRETGMLAAIGAASVEVFARPRVAILSTGDEIRAPGASLEPGQIYDSNQRILADAVTEAGGVAIECGIRPDDAALLAADVRALVVRSGVGAGADADADADVILLSGGTSKGAGDLNYRVVAELAAEIAGSPGIVVHGVALKPGKPICMAVVGRVPIVILPGFPTSAIFTFHEFVAPMLRRLGGRADDTESTVAAVAPLRMTSAVGRTDYQLVNLVPGARGLAAYPIGAGSGSVSAFSRADGFVRIPQDAEYVAEGTALTVRLLGRGVRPADLVSIGSHCVGLDRLLGLVAARGFVVKAISVGSQGGLNALARGEGDVAGTHLLDAATGVYNVAFLPPGVRLVKGWSRRQGLVFRRGDPRFEGCALDAFVAAAKRDGVRMVNRNAGSGTRMLIDGLLGGARPDGHLHQARSHHAVAAAVAQGRADWGMTLDVLAASHGLGFVFVREEEYDLAVPEARWDRPAVVALREALASNAGAAELSAAGFVRRIT